ncbi:MAG TPA: pilus assembly PilX N-terminal domain-containing protein [Deltaproteobacteria bacterium]|nr:pilus assembly PilX N-terminal domain-containing protein [Deltaproteobacteria bacterium]
MNVHKAAEKVIEIGRDEGGTVLVLVLLFMLATIVIGITLLRSTIVETQIVTNQREYNQNFYYAESAAEVILPQFDGIVSDRTWVEGTRVDVSDRMPDGDLDDAEVGMTLIRTGNPPVGSGTSAAKTIAYYFRVDATVNDQTVEMGFWKAFPKPGT